jgi:F-type H+-transporting ATPase subunit alpha
MLSGLKDCILGYPRKRGAVRRYTGSVTGISDGIAKVSGLLKIEAGEMVSIGFQGIKGMAINLEHDRVGVVVFGNDRSVRQGDLVFRRYRLMGIPLTMSMFGRVVDGLGHDLT